jgi:hypothetical protein
VTKLLNSIKEPAIALKLLNKIREADTTPVELQSSNAYVDSDAQQVTLNALLYFPDTIIDKPRTALEPSSPVTGDGGFLSFETGGDHG